MIKRDAVGSVLGILVFLGGVALLLLTFKIAYTMFSVPPEQALNLKPGKPMDFPAAGSTIVGVIIRIVLLALMAMVGSVIASRGIHLYSRAHAAMIAHRHEQHDS